VRSAPAFSVYSAAVVCVVLVAGACVVVVVPYGCCPYGCMSMSLGLIVEGCVVWLGGLIWPG